MTHPATTMTNDAMQASDTALHEIEKIAAMEFEPWLKSDNAPRPPSNSEWIKHGAVKLPIIRAGYAAMFRTKAELVEAFNSEPDAMTELVKCLNEVGQYFEAYQKLINGATARLFIAAHAACATEEIMDERIAKREERRQPRPPLRP